jgi:hypothetical protein
VIRLGLRLTLAGGREAAVRLIVTAAAVALGAGLLLVTLAGINAVNAQRDRYAWLGTGAGRPSPARPADGSASAHAAEPLWWRLSADQLGGTAIDRVDVAATGTGSPVLPGIPRLPGPGQFYASPALSQVLRDTPAAQLGDRFPGHQIGSIGRSALPAPNSLIIIIGHTARQLSRIPGATEATSIPAAYGPINCYGCIVGINANGVDLVFSVVAGALLFPVLIFIGAATRLSAARREQRFAAMRLVGGTPGQVSVISAVESTVAALAGTVVGFGVFFLLRPAVAAIPFTGAPFFTDELSLSPADVLAVAIGVPVAAAIVARLALRRVRISPLGVSRRVTPPAPRARRAIPLLIGVVELAIFVPFGHLHNTAGQVAEYLPGFLLIMAGLIVAGPWLTMIGARVMARRTSRPAALIAARRLADNPQAGFRAISGLVLALFVTTVTVGVIGSLSNERGSDASPAADTTLVDEFSAGQAGYSGSVAPIPAAVLTHLRSIRGVQGVTVIDRNAIGLPATSVGPPPLWSQQAVGLASCAQLSRTPALGRCAAGARAAAVPTFLLGGGNSDQAASVWSAAPISVQRLRRLRVAAVAVSTNGSAAAIERATTALEVAYPYQVPPATIDGIDSASPRGQDLSGWEQLANVVILASLAIAGCTLAASVAGGLSDRRRPFSLLRLSGVPLRMLRRIVALESAVPLLAVAVVSTGLGFLAAQLFLSAQFHYSLPPPGPGYYLVVLAGLAASFGVIASTLPLLNRITGPETARNE